jgi:hypothetical protein
MIPKIFPTRDDSGCDKPLRENIKSNAENRYNIDLRNYNEDLYKDNSHETVYYEYKA